MSGYAIDRYHDCPLYWFVRIAIITVNINQWGTVMMKFNETLILTGTQTLLIVKSQVAEVVDSIKEGTKH